MRDANETSGNETERVRLISPELTDIPADVVFLAGDTDCGTKGVVWARKRFLVTPVLYVAGNHEYHNERVGRSHEKLREAAAGSNVIILEKDTFELNGFRFFGAALWTDFALLSDRQSAMLAAGDKYTGINDYRKNRRHDLSKLQPKYTAMLHADIPLVLTKFLAAGDHGPSVVIIHYAPSLLLERFFFQFLGHEALHKSLFARGSACQGRKQPPPAMSPDIQQSLPHRPNY